METRDMVRMANQIADFFSAYGHDEAVKETANHIRMFWEPRMRIQLHDHVAKGAEGLKAVVVEAVGRLTPPKAA
ncbi:MAG: formate dehydrogenase subunit delta [Hyphomicrobiaceae bacterium]